MTDMEKKVMLWLCAKVIQYVDFETDQEAERRESIREALERGKEICGRRDELYESQQEVKHKLWKLEHEI